MAVHVAGRAYMEGGGEDSFSSTASCSFSSRRSVAREKAMHEKEEEVDTDDILASLQGLSIEALRAACRACGLSTSGDEVDLQTRFLGGMEDGEKGGRAPSLRGDRRWGGSVSLVCGRVVSQAGRFDLRLPGLAEPRWADEVREAAVQLRQPPPDCINAQRYFDWLHLAHRELPLCACVCSQCVCVCV